MAGFDLRFRIPPELETHLRARDMEAPREGQWARKDSAGHIARRDLARYYELLGRELATVQFSAAEASLVCDANNGTWWDEGWSQALLWANTADAIRLNGLDAKWGLSEQQGAALVARLQSLSPGQGLAVIDAVERFWAGCPEATVESVGLAPTPAPPAI